MRYPIFTYDACTYSFLPPYVLIDSEYGVQSYILDQIKEIIRMVVMKYPFYVFVGSSVCLIYDFNLNNNAEFNLTNHHIPDTHHIISFIKSDDTEYKLLLDKNTRQLFKDQMEDILQNIIECMDKIKVFHFHLRD